jgi:hypothetical protein
MITTKVSEQNLKALNAIKEIIEVEEDREVSVDQVLSRVIRLYRRFVPYQIQSPQTKVHQPTVQLQLNNNNYEIQHSLNRLLR